MSGEPEPRSAAEDEPSPTTAPTDEAADAAPSDRPQEAWAARRDLEDHVPRTMAFGAETRLAGGVLGGVNHGIGGGLFHGDVHVDARTHVHYGFGSMSAARSSGEIRAATLSGIAACFADPGPAFTTLVDQLREERVLVLSGPQSSGRRTAALMLLHRLGLSPVHSLARNAEPHSLFPEGDEESGAKGHLLCDLETDRNKPLRDVDLLALRDRLGRQDAYLVITVGPKACLEDVETVAWQPPAPADVLTAHLRSRLDEDSATALLALPVVTEFLARDHQPRETSAFASVLVEHASGNTSGEEVDNFSLAALEDQVREWFEEDDTVLHLREKSFLIALAAFDDGPYALTAEVSDRLYARLQETADSQLPAAVPVFGTHIGRRLQRARAQRYEADEPTEWGPVRQVKAAFRDDRTSLVLLREVWTGHPSARPALVQWLQELAKDGRPLVRTRASSTVAVLAHTDLPSAMALVIEPWAASPLYGPRTVAVHALALAHRIGTPNVPQILDAWCDSDALHLRWVAIRTHGLIGPERPVETLAALRTAAHREGRDEPDEFGDQDDGQLAEALAESVELLLLSTAKGQVLKEILRVQVRDQRMRTLALNGFLGACGRTERGVPKGRSLVLDWYAESLTTHTPAATGIRSLMRTALNDRDHRKRALDALRRWVFSVEGAPGIEGALAHLLSGIAVDEPERRRISHLLRTLPGEDGTPPPVANRLLAALPTL